MAIGSEAMGEMGEMALGAACTTTANNIRAKPLARPEKMTRHKICMNEDMVWKF